MSPAGGPPTSLIGFGFRVSGTWPRRRPLPGRGVPLQYRVLMPDDPSNPSDSRPPPMPPPPLVAAAGWLLPGAGYALLGQWGRGATIGVTVLSLFVAGLLIGGVRVLEVPGVNSDTGQRQTIPVYNDQGRVVAMPWILTAAPVTEIRNKPWSLPQAMVGPAAVVAGWGSVMAVGPDPKHPVGVVTHSRVNEIGQLYLSVAGLLNLLAIIDATFRAVRARDGEPAVPAAGQVTA